MMAPAMVRQMPAHTRRVMRSRRKMPASTAPTAGYVALTAAV